MRIVLASRSPARLKVLRAAGLDPEIIVSDVDEEALLAQLLAGDPDASPGDQVGTLAMAKAQAVAATVQNAVVVACDSMFELDGEVRGKPRHADDARRRLRQMSGRAGALYTGHHVIDTRTGRSAGCAVGTVVSVATMTDAEIDAYVGTGEPLDVAGSFTIDGLGGWFIDSLDGDHTNVIGISLPALRRLLRTIGIEVADLLGERRSEEKS